MPKCTQKCQQNFCSGPGWPTIYEDMGIHKHIKVRRHWSTSELPFEWCFAGGPIVARGCILSKYNTMALNV